VVGTASFHLGKKATETASHRWTVYLRSLDDEDISHFLKKVVFHLHNSFQNPLREMTLPPYEVTEQGWGEFEIIVELHFADDSMEGPVTIVHKLKLYAEDGTITKKAVVHEQYEELVFSQPVLAFQQRVANQVSMPAPPYSTAHHFSSFPSDAEAKRYHQVRMKVANIRANLQRQLEA